MSSAAEPTQGSPVHPFNYVPSFAAGVAFIVLFSLVTGLHLAQALQNRMWWLLPTVVLGGVTEVIGWSGRLWGNKNPTSMRPYSMQVTTTIISPTFILAANFVIVRQIIQKLGPQYSRLKPRLYILFLLCDIIALVVQSAGGAEASMANDPAGVELGVHIALGGIIFQFVAIIVYIFLTSEFLVRYHFNKPFPHRGDTFVGTSSALDSKTEQMIFGVYFGSLCMFIRGIYRTVELTGGLNGKVISNERLFIGLDGSLIVLSMVVLNIFHPGRLMVRGFGFKKFASRSAVGNVTKEVEVFSFPDTK